MSILLYHHPYSRAANVVWALEEVGVPYELSYVDIMAGQQKTPEFLAINPMGKLPVLRDGNALITEAAAIGLYLADRYALGRLAPKLDDANRGTYLRWAMFGPSVIEPAVMAKRENWSYRPSAAGWGTYESMLETTLSALRDRPFVLGDEFSMVDVLFGGTLRYMLMFKLIDPEPSLDAYVSRLNQRPQYQRAEAINAEVRKAHGLNG